MEYLSARSEHCWCPAQTSDCVTGPTAVGLHPHRLLLLMFAGSEIKLVVAIWLFTYETIAAA